MEGEKHCFTTSSVYYLQKFWRFNLILPQKMPAKLYKTKEIWSSYFYVNPNAGTSMLHLLSTTWIFKYWIYLDVFGCVNLRFMRKSQQIWSLLIFITLLWTGLGAVVFYERHNMCCKRSPQKELWAGHNSAFGSLFYHLTGKTLLLTLITLTSSRLAQSEWPFWNHRIIES